MAFFKYHVDNVRSGDLSLYVTEVENAGDILARLYPIFASNAMQEWNLSSPSGDKLEYIKGEVDAQVKRFLEGHEKYSFTSVAGLHEFLRDLNYASELNSETKKNFARNGIIEYLHLNGLGHISEDLAALGF